MPETFHGRGKGPFMLRSGALIQTFDHESFDKRQKVFIFDPGQFPQLSGGVSLPVNLRRPVEASEIVLQRMFQLEQKKARFMSHRVGSKCVNEDLLRSHGQGNVAREVVVEFAGFDHFIESFGRVEKLESAQFG